MTHDEFFTLQIDADRPPPAEKLAEIEQHRHDCPRCAELERNHARLRQLVKKIPTKLGPAPESVDQAVMAHVRKSVARGGPATWRPGCRAAATLLVVALAGTATWRLGFPPQPSPDRGTKEPTKEPPPHEPPKEPPAQPPKEPPRDEQWGKLSGGMCLDLEAAKVLYRIGYFEQAKILAEHAKKKGDLQENEEKFADEVLKHP